MSEIVQPGLLHLIRHTPLRDVIRGRFTGRLDLESRIAASNVPEQAKAIVWRVIRQTRLWSLEKAQLTDELLAHFTDGLDAGATIEQLVQQFGDEERAALLIRRAKKRNRPLPWWALRLAGWLFLALVVTYLGMAVVFFMGSPAISVNYLDRLNRPLGEVTQDQSAWPIYRDAILAFGYHDKAQEQLLNRIINSRPGSKNWPQLESWITSHRQEIELIRQGAKLPTLGIVYGPGGTSDDTVLWPGTLPQARDDMLISVYLRHLNDLRTLTQLLAADAELARSQSDSPSLVQDLNALIGIAEQSRSDGFVVTSLTALGNRFIALTQIAQTLADSPQLLSDADLQRLAHLLAEPRVAADLIRLDDERMIFYDLVQRMYTDDGHGDGRLTPQGLRLLRLATTPSASPLHNLEPADVVAGPASVALCAGRREILDEYNQMMDLAMANLNKPARDGNWTEFNRRIERLRTSSGHLRYLPLAVMMPSMQGVQLTAERYLGQRDGVLIAIALETYRRSHGKYPGSLNELTPSFLPRVPADPVAGEPVCYKLVDGKPLVYSVGFDRDDDSGRLPLNKSGTPEPWSAAQWNLFTRPIPDGDWVLYPQPMEKEPDE
jgi:hypothetical protein